jgi:hypothetical protein
VATCARTVALVFSTNTITAVLGSISGIKN